MSSDDNNNDPTRTSGTFKLPRSGLAKDLLPELRARLARKQAGEPEPESSSADAPESAEAIRDTPEVGETVSEVDLHANSRGGATRSQNQLLEFADKLAEMQLPPEESKRRRLETWITFELQSEIFALPVSHVREVLRVEHITPVPHAPDLVRGITNLRGRVIPVVDTRRRLGLPSVEPGPTSRILVVDAHQRMLGFLVDAARKVVRIDVDAIQPAPDDVMTDKSNYIVGVLTDDSAEILIVLDVERVLDIGNHRVGENH